MHNRLNIPIQPPKRVKTESIKAEATPVPTWKKELKKTMREVLEDESK